MEHFDFKTRFLWAVAWVGAAACAPEGALDTATDERGTAAGIDLVVRELTGPDSATPGAPIEVAVRVCNDGLWDSPGTDIEIYLSTDTVLSPLSAGPGQADPFVGQVYMPWLTAGTCADLTVQGFAAVPMDGAYLLAASADPYQLVPETEETNNVTFGARVGVGHAPNLVVGGLTAPPSAEPGAPLTVDVEVCNRGTQPASGADVTVYLSLDTTIEGISMIPGPGQMPDPFVGQAFLPWLDTGRCATVSVDGYAATFAPGPHYVAAIVDEYGAQLELIEDDNTGVGALMGIGFGPNLVVTEIEAPPTSRNHVSYPVVATVCNVGTGPAPQVELTAYASDDATIETVSGAAAGGLADAFLGQTFGGYLDAGRCRRVDIPGWLAVPTPGPQFIGVVVDEYATVPELIETDNVTVGPRVGVGDGPDLVVTAIEAPPSVVPGGGLEVEVTVCNQGNQPAFADVSLYLSLDEDIQGGPGAGPGGPNGPTADTFLGQAWISQLEPDRCRVETLLGWAAVPMDGAYFVGAIADEFNAQPELLEENNVFVGDRVGVGHAPNLRIASIAGPPSVRPGDPLDVDVEVCNDGTTPAFGSDVFVYLTADAHIEGISAGPSAADPFVGQAWFGHLPNGQCTTVPVNGWAVGPQTGALFLGATVDEYNGQPELLEDDNATLGPRIGVGVASNLVVRGLTAPASARPGDAFTAEVEVCNEGTLDAYSADVTLYLSTDAVIEGGLTSPGQGDAFAGQAWVGQVPAGACRPASVSAWVSVPQDGVYFVGAIVDEFGAEPELIEDDNATAGPRMGVGHAPNYTIREIVAPPSALNGGTFDVSVTVCNDGTVPGGGVDITVYLSDDQTVDGQFSLQGPPPQSDSFVGSAWTSQPLMPGQCRAETVVGWAGVPTDGAYFVGAIVDEYASQPELLEDDNAAIGPRVGIGAAPNLVIEAVTTPANAAPGGAFDVDVTVCNRGTQLSWSTDVTVFLSTDEVLDGLQAGPSGDAFVGQAHLTSIVAGQCVTRTVPGFVPVPEGRYFPAAWVDEFQAVPELIEDDNQAFGAAIGVGWLPDLVVTAAAAPASAMPGGAFDVDVTVCNQGTTPAYGADLLVYLSEDETIEGIAAGPNADSFAGQLYTGPLQPGQCRTMTVPGWAGVPSDGAYFVGVTVDEWQSQPELQEDNNVFVGGQVGIGHAPDWTVEAIVAPTSARFGDTLVVQVTVCNRGTVGPASGDVMVYLTDDDVIDTFASGSPTPDPFFGQVFVNQVGVGQCRTEPVTGWPHAPSPGSYRFGVVVDEYDSTPELLETNNAALSAPVALTP